MALGRKQWLTASLAAAGLVFFLVSGRGLRAQKTVAPEEALYVGDLYSVDILGARAAGMEAVLLGNPGDTQVDCRQAQSIEELVQQLLSGDLGMKHVSESDT